MGRLGHTLSTLRPDSRLPGRKTRFRLLARLFRVDSMTHWVPPKGFFDASYIAFLLSQAFPGASALRSETPHCVRVTGFGASDTSTEASNRQVARQTAMDKVDISQCRKLLASGISPT